MTAPTTTVTTREVTEDEADIRLDRWFRRHFPTLTQGAIQKFCRTGQVRVDGRRADASTRLAPGQAIRVPPIPAPPTMPTPAQALDPKLAAEMRAMVLYADDHLIVINKPQGLPTQGGPGISKHVDMMLAAFKDDDAPKPRLVHRLDRETSGVLVVARTPGTAAKLAAAFRSREVHKTYWAIVCGRPVPVDGRIDVELARVDGFKGERAAVAGAYDTDTARAITDYRTLDHAGRKLAWLELSPLTGRTHQLRVSCAALGAPILGDLPYGEERPHEERRNTALYEGLGETLHLHARRLELPHPAGGWLTVEAELPGHMVETFTTLGFTASAALEPIRK